MLEINQFLNQRETRRPSRIKIPLFMKLTGLSQGPAYEIQWGMYDPLPPAAQRAEVIDPNYYIKYRKETRILFGQITDPPPFRGFANLANHFDIAFQALGKCLCLQRSLMAGYDKAQVEGRHYFRQELWDALAIAWGPEYAEYLNNHPWPVGVRQLEDNQDE